MDRLSGIKIDFQRTREHPVHHRASVKRSSPKMTESQHHRAFYGTLRRTTDHLASLPDRPSVHSEPKPNLQASGIISTDRPQH
jgi:hypothetical protein